MKEHGAVLDTSGIWGSKATLLPKLGLGSRSMSVRYWLVMESDKVIKSEISDVVLASVGLSLPELVTALAQSEVLVSD